MGSYNEFVTGKGKSKAEAFDNAWRDYVDENGHRCSFRGEIKAKLLRTEPPLKRHVEKGAPVRFKGRMEPMEIISMQPDPTAPTSEWVQVWEFEVWVHS